jgi:hypothetical protein
VWDRRLPQELLDQSGLPDTPPAAHEHALAGLGSTDGLADLVDRVSQRAQFSIPADETMHEDGSRRGNTAILAIKIVAQRILSLEQVLTEVSLASDRQQPPHGL